MPGVAGVNVAEKGVTRSTPSEVAPLKNSTCLMVPSLSVAVALMVMGAPAPNAVGGLVVVGDVMFTVGSTFAFAMMEMAGDEVFDPPELSVAFAVRE